MISFLLASVNSYRICPEKIPARDDLYFEKEIKAEHWAYFTVKLNESQIGLRCNITTTGNASFYVGSHRKCPYKEEKPFFRGGNVKNHISTIWKISKQSFPFGIYAEDEASVAITFTPISVNLPNLNSALFKYGPYVLLVLAVLGFLYDKFPWKSLMFWKRKDKRRRHHKRN
ncbi:hypothetical protein TVAG_346430 [Trichomonas vaginalis G3]|uniref:Uncharacterized protein n=1 Tax=Trichomonas vaginalis (strain ATCC PRA-98 / G3) TaxID=412133 RepID=A2GAT6_TRIV3|nr:hypothetical protein TVAGG3_0411620 [Trichomonas vaginalis G3]EAX85737.1 hypothetical protein TVAG_346430 [Trichomonas vaginalis G3]KAI5535388.1 hypothetical protein TVAGG3_0411620 [Trichomonas vaginalis G3]|eukprot:XP_001298667.1 hypothetical protein [Trichomonas vaginalis G3]